MLYGSGMRQNIARALAGRLRHFINVILTSILDGFCQQLPKRTSTPCSSPPAGTPPVVLFLDEIDAIGQARPIHQRRSGVTSQLLMEMDGIGADNEGLMHSGRHQYAVGRRPPAQARSFDRSVAVLPHPTRPRHSIYYLKDRPMEGIDLGRAPDQRIHRRGLAHLVDSACRFAMMDFRCAPAPSA